MASWGPDVRIEEARQGEAPARCEPILRSVPEWFGIEESTRAYIEAAGRLPTWIATVAGSGASGSRVDAGFITIERHFEESADIHCIAVDRRVHGSGVGTALVRAVEEQLARIGVRYLQVKTMGPSTPNAEYAQTLKFYLRCGFARMEEVHGLWPGIPCLILVKKL